jgi:cobalt-zinc-cadmium resistance protein CzcA
VSDPHEAPEPDLASGPPSFANQIVRAALNQKFLVVIAALVLVGVGSWSFTRLPVDAYPDLSPPMVEITTQWPGHAAEEVERLVTVPIETEMNGVERVKVVRSI